MSDRSHLVPEVRTDRNGRRVTRHVRPSRSPSPSTGIPSPSSPSPAATRGQAALRSELIARTAEAYANEFVAGSDHGSFEWRRRHRSALERFAELPTIVLEELAAFRGSPDLFEAVDVLLSSDAPLSTIRDLLHSNGTIDARFEHVNALDLAGYVFGLTRYELEPVEREGPYPARRAEQCAALLAAARELPTLMTYRHAINVDALDFWPMANAGLNFDVFEIADRRLVQLLISRSGDGERIADFMRARKTDDVDTLLLMLECPATALADGVL